MITTKTSKKNRFDADIVQPMVGGRVNPRFVQIYGRKRIKDMMTRRNRTGQAEESRMEEIAEKQLWEQANKLNKLKRKHI